MTDEQLRKTWEIFREAADLPLSEQAAYARSASNDAAVVEEVLSMLSRHSAGNRSSADPPPGDSGAGDRTGLPIGIGSHIGPYTITGLLGRGGLGEVFSARDTVLGRTVALKMLASANPTGPFDVARQIREASAASSLNHPNIVSIYQVVECGSLSAIAMELVDGKSFRQLGGHPLPLDNLCHFGIQICHALAAAHRQGIIHRDIKPENLMVRPDGLVKVLDFGLARDIARETSAAGTGILVGTLRYMSPEQTRVAKLTGSTDIFSLGLVLYELACARHPFDAASPLEVAHAIVASEPPPPMAWNARIPARLQELILAMLAKDPDARPSAEGVAGELAALARGEHASLQEAAPPRLQLETDSAIRHLDTAIPVSARRLPRWPWAAALASLILAAAVVIWVRPFGERPAALVPGTSGVVPAVGPDDPIPPRHFFALDQAGIFLAYRDDSADEGGFSRWIAQSVAVPQIKGVNFASFQHWVAGGDGVLYAIGKDRTVTYFRLLDPWRNKGPLRWSPDSNTVIGRLSGAFAQAAGISRPVWRISNPDGVTVLEREWETGIIRGGTLFTLDDKDVTSLFLHGWSATGSPSTLSEASAWSTSPPRYDYVPRFRGPRLPPREKCARCQIFEGGTGITFAVTPQGDLLRFRQRPGGEWVPAAGKFARGPFATQIGHDWKTFQSVLVEPGAYQIEGYVSTERGRGGKTLATMSVEPGETVKIRASTFSPAYSARLLRLQRSRWEGPDGGSGLIDGWPVGTQVSVAVPGGGNFKKPQNNAMYKTGAGWPGDGADVPLPNNAPSGIYAAELTTPSGGRFLAPFIVRPPRNRRHQIAVIVNVATWNAYNQWGGGSRFVVFQGTSPGRPLELSFERPLMDAPLYGGASASPGLTNRGKRDFNQLARAEVWLTSVLDAFATVDRKYAFDVFSDVDLHAGIDQLAGYSVLILQTLPQFWTDRMRDQLDAYLATGGHLVYLGGRGLSERAVISGEGKFQFAKGPGEGCSPIKGGDWSCPALDLFRWQTEAHPDGRSERTVLGVAYEGFWPQIDFAHDGDYFTIWSSHPSLFARTGLVKGASLGNVRGVNANLRAADGEENSQYSRGYCPEIAGSRCSATHTTLTGDLLAVSSAKTEIPISHSSIVFRTTDAKSGWVFSIGSLSVGGVLAIDPTLQQVLRNALDAGLAGDRPGKL